MLFLKHIAGISSFPKPRRGHRNLTRQRGCLTQASLASSPSQTGAGGLLWGWCLICRATPCFLVCTRAGSRFCALGECPVEALALLASWSCFVMAAVGPMPRCADFWPRNVRLPLRLMLTALGIAAVGRIPKPDREVRQTTGNEPPGSGYQCWWISAKRASLS